MFKVRAAAYILHDAEPRKARPGCSSCLAAPLAIRSHREFQISSFKEMHGQFELSRVQRTGMWLVCVMRRGQAVALPCPSVKIFVESYQGFRRDRRFAPQFSASADLRATDIRLRRLNGRDRGFTP